MPRVTIQFDNLEPVVLELPEHGTYEADWLVDRTIHTAHRQFGITDPTDADSDGKPFEELTQDLLALVVWRLRGQLDPSTFNYLGRLHRDIAWRTTS